MEIPTLQVVLAVSVSHMLKKSTFHVGSPLLLGLVVTVTLGVFPDDVH